ncbi:MULTISPECIES: metal ABC transporter ATP-binding protein [Methylocaldum]|jgi:ABC-type Mn2+/Zn2+ transport system ATPase subunit|uniref:metal ABC transporter ATP-binding protein n=1 Tax=unclassified Methylocaldum TaxID=2622260 RepID=UPI00098A6EDA|nr:MULTISPECIES: metal ABC transporter ATP-binding protein [unclassified Methylocaldum]MBP1150113.1 zinc transport system ATP-binding protein [Methylocaldum sp. RMAD-M]MVF24015.1 metal ABC transporter ATP-binding protein [Methylocaldum sp. BRCS4]
MTDNQPSILTVQGISVSYGDETIIRDLSFSVAEGAVFVILGPNGAGKTTLLRALLGLIPYQGTVTWQTRNISYLPPQEFLQRQELPPLSIEEFFRFKTRDVDAVKRMFAEVGLDESLLQRPFGALSTGQFQRMLIAWALVNDPDVLLLDEPTAGIDVGGEETIYTLLNRYRQRKPLTILLVTHDLHVVWEYASVVLCLNRQQLCMGAPQEVLTPQQLQALYGTGVKYYEHHHR